MADNNVSQRSSACQFPDGFCHPLFRSSKVLHAVQHDFLSDTFIWYVWNGRCGSLIRPVLAGNLSHSEFMFCGELEVEQKAISTHTTSIQVRADRPESGTLIGLQGWSGTAQFGNHPGKAQGVRERPSTLSFPPTKCHVATPGCLK